MSSNNNERLAITTYEQIKTDKKALRPKHLERE